jgi:hypothetical protein
VIQLFLTCLSNPASLPSKSCDDWQSGAAAIGRTQNEESWGTAMHKARRARAVAIAQSQDLEKTMRLRFFAIAVGATAALLALPVLF